MPAENGRPVLGPERIARSTGAPERGEPAPQVRVAVSVAVPPSKCDWLKGARARAPGVHGGLPMLVQGMDSLSGPGGGLHEYASTPRVLITCPVSLYVVVTLSTVTSTVGIIPSGVQFPE